MVPRSLAKALRPKPPAATTLAMAREPMKRGRGRGRSVTRRGATPAGSTPLPEGFKRRRGSSKSAVGDERQKFNLDSAVWHDATTDSYQGVGEADLPSGHFLMAQIINEEGNDGGLAAYEIMAPHPEEPGGTWLEAAFLGASNAAEDAKFKAAIREGVYPIIHICRSDQAHCWDFMPGRLCAHVSRWRYARREELLKRPWITPDFKLSRMEWQYAIARQKQVLEELRREEKEKKRDWIVFKAEKKAKAEKKKAKTETLVKAKEAKQARKKATHCVEDAKKAMKAEAKQAEEAKLKQDSRAAAAFERGYKSGKAYVVEDSYVCRMCFARGYEKGRKEALKEAYVHLKNLKE